MLINEGGGSCLGKISAKINFRTFFRNRPEFPRACVKSACAYLWVYIYIYIYMCIYKGDEGQDYRELRPPRSTQYENPPRHLKIIKGSKFGKFRAHERKFQGVVKFKVCVCV